VDAAELVREHLEHLADDAGVLGRQQLELGNAEHHHRRVLEHDRRVLAGIAAEGRLHPEELAGLDQVADLLARLDVDVAQADPPGVEEEDAVSLVTLEVDDGVGPVLNRLGGHFPPAPR
jgi:hypothetical protein